MVREDAHEAIVPRGLWRKCQTKRRPSARSGRLTQRYLLQGLATCASCGRAMYLSGGQRTKDYAHYVCRRPECDRRAYARAQALDDHVMNVLEGELNPADSSNWVPRPGGDDAEVSEAEAAVEDAKADLDGYLADTTLRRTLGAERYAEAVGSYVAVVNKAEAP